MTFLWPAMLWLMLLVPVTVFVLRLAMQRRSRTASSFADAPLLDTGNWSITVISIGTPLTQRIT